MGEEVYQLLYGVWLPARSASFTFFRVKWVLGTVGRVPPLRSHMPWTFNRNIRVHLLYRSLKFADAACTYPYSWKKFSRSAIYWLIKSALRKFTLDFAGAVNIHIEQKSKCGTLSEN